MQNTGADQPVVAVKLPKGSGAKGLSYPFYWLVNQNWDELSG